MVEKVTVIQWHYWQFQGGGQGGVDKITNSLRQSSQRETPNCMSCGSFLAYPRGRLRPSGALALLQTIIQPQSHFNKSLEGQWLLGGQMVAELLANGVGVGCHESHCPPTPLCCQSAERKGIISDRLILWHKQWRSGSPLGMVEGPAHCLHKWGNRDAQVRSILSSQSSSCLQGEDKATWVPQWGIERAAAQKWVNCGGGRMVTIIMLWDQEVGSQLWGRVVPTGRGGSRLGEPLRLSCNLLQGVVPVNSTTMTRNHSPKRGGQIESLEHKDKSERGSVKAT